MTSILEQIKNEIYKKGFICTTTSKGITIQLPLYRGNEIRTISKLITTLDEAKDIVSPEEK